ncbi:MAG TPA: zf-HC2 domain-containing protein [Pyrinomonadaceae bacterium]|nr:zf-HC2 domain-containing protein [Pyrinomonadaceae bacterium]
MNQASNNEIDLLLRSFARGDKDSALRSGLSTEQVNAAASNHLDADELNSYAEGVVPAPARARYIEHLAECEACRSVVISLVPTAGAVNAAETREKKASTDFWQKLRTLFTPPVLRFAVPALMLAAVMGIGLWAVRRQQPAEYIAQNKVENSPSPQISTGSQPSAANESTATNQSKTPAEKNLGSTTEKSNGALEKPDANQKRAVDETEVAKLPAAKDAGTAGAVAGVSELRPYDLAPKAAAPPPPTPLLDADKSATLAKERPAKREEQEPTRDDQLRNREEDVHEPNRAAAQRNTTSVPSNGRVGGLMSTRGVEKRKIGGGETRTVAGRHFTREGDAWVDTAYEPSRATIKVARGSDQFRALVADEPGIRAIAEQLNGVVIVVWNNRAYRIQ